MEEVSFGFAALFAASLLGGLVGAGVTHVPMAHAAGSEQVVDSVTVFVDATFGFRKKHMASQLTKSHARYEAMGYRFADMEPYVENGDLVGFFVTYTRR